MQQQLANQHMVRQTVDEALVYMSLGQELAKDYVYQVGEITALRLLFNRHMDDAMLAQFVAMDRGVCVAHVTDALGYDFCRKYLNKSSLHKIGLLAAKTESELLEKYQIPSAGVDKIKAYLSGIGLELGMDTTQWQLYRRMVPRGFEMLRINDPGPPYLIAGSQDYLA